MPTFKTGFGLWIPKEMPKLSHPFFFSGGFLCWLGSQLPLQHSALCISSETRTCLGIWRTGWLWSFHQGWRAESQVLQTLSFDRGTCHFGKVLREIIDTMRGLGENVYPWLEQPQDEDFLPFWKSINLCSLILPGESTLKHPSGAFKELAGLSVAIFILKLLNKY